jgi:hypothetical protein
MHKSTDCIVPQPQICESLVRRATLISLAQSLAGLGLVEVSLAALSPNAHSKAAASGMRPARRGPIDWQDPADSIEAFTRIRADVSGALAYTYTRGSLYLVRPGVPAALFLDYEAGLVDRCERLDFGTFRQTRREIMNFLDPVSGELANTVANPITGRNDRPIHGLVGPLKFAVTPRGIAFNSHDPAQAPGAPLALHWRATADSTAVTMRTLRRYRNTQQPNDWPTASTGEYRSYADFLTYTVSSRELHARRAPSLGAQLFYSGQTDMQPWMFVGRAPGHMLWHASGFKTARLSDLPADFVARTERMHAGFWRDPLGYPETTRSYEEQLRERM